MTICKTSKLIEVYCVWILGATGGILTCVNKSLVMTDYWKKSDWCFGTPS